MLYMAMSENQPIRRYPKTVVYLALLVGLAHAVPVSAQYTLIGNQFINGFIFTDPPTNRFFINAGSAQNGVKFLYGGNADNATSNIVFRIESGGSTYYYCNNHPTFQLGRPIEPFSGREVTYKPFDSLYVSADTLAIGYKNMSGWNVTQRWIVEKQRTPYDDGTDLVLEFTATANPFAPPGNVGVFLMLDLYNGEAGNPNPSDFTSVITNNGYYPRGQPGKRFSLPFDTIPQFYMTGNVGMQPAAMGSGVPYNVRMPIHRLTGFTQRGKPLTTPDVFAIGDWRSRMREYSWDIYSEVGTTPLNDVATSMRWENLNDGKTIRTAFGMNNRAGNNVYTCRDTGFFVMMRTERVVEQTVKNGAYSPQSFDLEVWVINQDNSLRRDIELYFQTPIQSNRGPNRLLLDPSTPARQGLTIPANGVRKVVWRLNFNPAFSDDSADVVPEIRYAVPTRPGLIRRFKQLCTPTITIKRFIEAPPPQDTIAPMIVRGTPGRIPTVFWPFTLFDRHIGYRYDTGLDGIIIEANDGSNFRITQNPAPFRRCDTTVTVGFVVEVIDTTKPARIVFSTLDCRGNRSRDSAIYNPRPDLFAPAIVRFDSIGSFGPPCNHRQFEVEVLDSLIQLPTAGDNGMGSITMVGTPDNFTPPSINVDRGGVPIADFDRRASFRVSVIDSMRDGRIDLQIADYAGNADTVTITYCTLPDMEKPRSTVTPAGTGGPWTWSIETVDTLAWDRGLQEVVVLANPGNNMTYVPPSILPGIGGATWDVSVVDDRMDATVVFEVRDTWYSRDPRGHADTVTVRFLRTPDTLAPNIIVVPLVGTGGSRADVEVNDVHYFGPERYRFDLGLSTITVVEVSPNMELVTPISFSPGDSVTTFGIRIKDTLAFNTIDSICLEATDLAGNRSSLCYYYPIQPDAKPPVFTGRIDQSRVSLTGVATDDRPYDRGLGEITIESPENLDGTTMTVRLSGNASTPYAVLLSDPEARTRGTLVIRDLVALRDPSPETEATHVIRIPFDLPVARLALEMPTYVEGGEVINAYVINKASIPGARIPRLEFSFDATGAATWFGSSDGAASLTVTPGGGGRFDVLAILDSAIEYLPGDTLGSLRWTTGTATGIQTLALALDGGSLVANGANGSFATGGPLLGDTALSILELPAPLLRMTADSVVYINGECERFLTTQRGLNRTTGLAILNVRPSPIAAHTTMVELDVRDMPATGGTVELVDGLGRRLFTRHVESEGVRLSRYRMPLPSNLPGGLYFVRIVADGMEDWIKVAVVR